MKTQGGPRLSVVVAAVSGPEAVGRCLRSLERELAGTDVELVVVEEDASRSEFAMRLEGLRRATGEIVAVVGDRYEIRPGWLRSVKDSQADVESGCVEPGTGLSWAGWAMYLAEYSHVAPPMPAEVLDARGAALVPGGNAVYRRGIWDGAAGCEAENAWHLALFRSGARFRRQPAMLAAFSTPPGVKTYVRQRFAASKAWGRARADGLRPGARMAGAVSRLLLPALLIWRRGRNCWGRGRHRARLAAALPWLVLFALVESVGEFVGFLAVG